MPSILPVIFALLVYLAPPAAVAAFSSDLGKLKKSFAWPLSVQYLPRLCVVVMRELPHLVRFVVTETIEWWRKPAAETL